MSESENEINDFEEEEEELGSNEEIEDDEDDDNNNQEEEDEEEEIKDKKNKKKSLVVSEAEDYSKKLAKRGVVYLSRIPPFMKPNKVRYELEQYGEVTRLYLAEEDPGVRKRRKIAGGNGSKQFVEGWIEFADKKVAKRIAQSLNNTPMGGKKRNFYHDDLWNLKYLKNFKWDMLTEKFAYERRVRESKLRAAMQQAKQRNAEFIEMVEKDKIQKQIEEKKRKRHGGDKEENTTNSSSSQLESNDSQSLKKFKRHFKQIQPR
eukprot:CAMPEP_0174821010 /NCGR_PEP_ID=MMETSP1107-20130205/5241_1 /TAXON_ID=36770 /ORGANISM="Paraphysomonas vestita, Strain GFlagA" /LENGTH=261 /DNA_ID=CAMNT_0016037523 /DNA_START=42 /DNA_END=824 /DNA_ORIENTATION=+